ncbi:acyl-CoA dehydrogenase middle domain-containing protein [Sporosarcina obsidiansis]|uniref:hypothetical protein n=1 Tax=Sporosarcina obsidiansis TaxID=2660748 RepID=UPI002ED068B0
MLNGKKHFISAAPYAIVIAKELTVEGNERITALSDPAYAGRNGYGNLCREMHGLRCD